MLLDYNYYFDFIVYFKNNVSLKKKKKKEKRIYNHIVSLFFVVKYPFSNILYQWMT